MNSNPYPRPISSLFRNTVIYTMPMYQREYVWSVKTQLKDYKDDLEMIWETATSPKPQKIFLGAIVLQETKKTSPVESDNYIVIDGQQRITTVYMTLLALAHHAFEKGWKTEAESLVKRQLISNGASTVDEPIVDLTNKDTKQFNSILKNIEAYQIKQKTTPLGRNTGELIEAYNFIKTEVVDELINSFPGNPKNVYDQFTQCFLDNFVIADITLDPDEHNPNEVFNRLNTRGQKLEIIDLIRNNCFMRFGGNLNASQSFYINDWEPFQTKLSSEFPDTPKKDDAKEKFIDKQVNNFFYPFGVNQRSNMQKGKLVNELNDFWGNTKPKAIVKQMDEYIDPYLTWIEGNDVTLRINSKYSKDLKSAIIGLKQLKTPLSTYPFLMRCLLEVNANNLSEKEAAKSFRIIESFIVRRAMAFQEEGTGYEAIFKRLWDATNGNSKLVRSELPSKTKSFPDDPEFEKGILNTPLYGKKICRYMLLQYEIFLRKKALESYPKEVIETIDHINPRKYPNKLTKVQAEEHERTLHLWGNLLPMSIGLNSSKNNRPMDKELRQHVKANCKLNTTFDFLGQTTGVREWTPNQIDKRTKKLAKWALTRWKDN